jgi:hypothetical protein
MVIELAVLFAVVAAMGATVVKVYEWRQDVLYGPYLAPQARETKCKAEDYKTGRTRRIRS